MLHYGEPGNAHQVGPFQLNSEYPEHVHQAGGVQEIGYGGKKQRYYDEAPVRAGGQLANLRPVQKDNEAAYQKYSGHRYYRRPHSEFEFRRLFECHYVDYK